ncbi:MAG TPA: AGE family epimerase/isomerase [Opitutaceae bacterium]|nr:AGE family epimerase/isomerase [Opitutaceae bacterium]
MSGAAPLPDLLEYANRIETDLRANVLPFWVEHAVGADGRIVGALTNDLRSDPAAERGMLLAARVLWTFAAAYQRYHDRSHATLADTADAELQTWFWDSAHGGYRWAGGPDGAPTRDRKQIYGQAFGIYALAEYHAATQRPQPLNRAIQLYELIERHARDGEHGGYFEAFDAAWGPMEDVRLSEVDQNDPKSQNTHLHIMEAYTRLLRCWPDPRLRATLAGLVELMLNRIVQPNGHLGLFFDREWRLRSDRVSYGHDIEAAWLLNDAAAAVGDAALAARTAAVARRIADLTLAEGVDEDGGVYNEGGPDGLTNTNKEWWPQAEAVVGFLDAYERWGDHRYLAAALRAWDFIDRSLIDRRHGEWYRGVTRDGRLLDRELKIGFWKCPYHNGRAALESTTRLRRLAAGRPND